MECQTCKHRRQEEPAHMPFVLKAHDEHPQIWDYKTQTTSSSIMQCWKKKPWEIYAWWCMQNEGKSPLGWMQWLCNICMHTVKLCTVYMNQNDHASVTLLAVFVAGENSVYTDKRLHHASQAECDTFLAKFLPWFTYWSYPHFLVYCCCHSSANTLLPP